MTRKLVNIKNILRIIISCFVIVNMVRSCAKAVTNVPQTLLDEINTNIEKVANYYGIDHYPTYTNQISKDSSNLYCIFITDSTSPWQPNMIGAFFPQYDTLSTTYNGSQFLNNIRSQCYSTVNNTVNGFSDWSVNKNAVFKYMYTQFDWDSKTLHNYIADNEYGADIILAPPITYYFGNLHTKEITYNGESVLANTLSYNYRLAPIVNVVCEDTIITSMQATLDDLELKCNDLGNYWNLTYNNSTMFKYNQLYNLRVDSVIDGNIETLEAKILFVPPGTIIENNSIVSSPSGDFSFNTENATNQIIDNQNENNYEIINTINNIVGNLPAVLSGDNSGDASGDLSSGFDGGGGILGGIFSLFVPDGQFFKDYFEDLNNWFSDRLGLLYFPIELTIDFLTRCLNIDFTSQVLSIGPYVLPLNDNFELVPEIEIDFNSFLEDETVNSIHEVYLFITDGLIIFGLYRLIIKKYNNIVKNKGGG